MRTKKRDDEIKSIYPQIVQFLKTNPLENFVCFTDVDKQFGLYQGFCHRHLYEYFPAGKKEQYFDETNNILYLTHKGIANMLNFGYEKVQGDFLKYKIPFIRIYHETDGKKVIKQFYHFDKIYQSLPKEYQLFYNNFQKLENEKNQISQIILSKPKKLTIKQYYVFCGLILFKTHFDLWPSLIQICHSVKKIFDFDINQYKVSQALIDLKKHGFIEKYKCLNQNNSYIYQIYKGPIVLTHKKVNCIDPITQRDIKMFAPYDFYKGD